MKRLALVTGAAGGIGRAITTSFVDAGWEVLAVDLSWEAVAEPSPAQVEADVSNESAVDQLFETILERHEKLDALINNAAVQFIGPIVEMTAADWDQTMATNLRSIFLMSRGAHNLLKAAGGAVVNVGSVHAVATSPHIAAYAASKGGVVTLTRALALEFAQDGVRVNAVLPGAVDTPMLRAGLQRERTEQVPPDRKMHQLASRTPLGRIGQPHEIAQAILFLADHRRSSFITGQTVIVDGGATAQLSTE